jgi:TPR repeat protein
VKVAYEVAAALIFAAGFAASTAAGPFEDGLDAARRADYATVLRLWRPLAEQGNTQAQSNLGLMYFNGRGVSQDYVSAYMWFGLAAAEGDGDAEKNRDRVATKMTSAQIVRARRLADEWRPK